jgi:hypothetical protein
MLHSKHCYIVVKKIVYSGISIGLGKNVCVIYAEILTSLFFDMYLIVVTHVCLGVI